MSKALPQDAAGDGVCGGSTNSAGPSGITTYDDWDCLTPSNTITPSIKAIPKMATFNGDLYMIRNACSSVSVAQITSSVQTTCGTGNEVPQLWRLNQGAGDTAANARAGWTLVAEYGTTGKTNMTGATWVDGSDLTTKAAANSEITMLVVNGNRLYIGFDNATYGINLWRTKSTVTRASVESDFEAICQTGYTCFTSSKQFGFGGSDRKIFDAISVNDAGKDYVIISARNGVNPLRIYRTDNN